MSIKRKQNTISCTLSRQVLRSIFAEKGKHRDIAKKICLRLDLVSLSSILQKCLKPRVRAPSTFADTILSASALKSASLNRRNDVDI